MNEDDIFEKRRATEFPQLASGIAYLDWTGAAIPPAHLIDACASDLRGTLLGNPHSLHTPSMTSKERVDETRKAILTYVRANPEEYEVVFTANATQAILILQHFQFEGGEILLSTDNHNSVNGLRMLAQRAGAVVRYAPLQPNLELHDASLAHLLAHPRTRGQRLFAYPAKSNYSGIVHDLKWVRYAQQNGWKVLLDAAAYAANDRLDLSKTQPDFVALSFYKLFGFPTGVGCLLIRKDAYASLSKRWFSGGSIHMVSVAKDIVVHESTGYARFEDGTVNFALIPAVMNGLRFIQSLPPLKPHAVKLMGILYTALMDMRGKHGHIDLLGQPGTDIVTFNVVKQKKVVDVHVVERAANAAGVCIRGGCFCNPGASEVAFGYSAEMLARAYNTIEDLEHFTPDMLKPFVDGRPVGALRASAGYANIPPDIHKLINFLDQYVNEP